VRPGPPRSGAGSLRHWLLRAASVLVFVAVVDYLVLPQLAGTAKAFRLLDHVEPAWALLAIVLEGLSDVSYSLLTRSVLPRTGPSFSWLLRTDITSLGVSHVLPGGAASSTALRYRLLREGGADADDVAVGMTVQGVGSTLVLVMLVWVALVVSIPLAGLHPLYLSIAIAGAIALAVAVAVALRRPAGTARAENAPHWLTAHLPRRVRPRAERLLDESLVRLRQLLADRTGLRTSAGWAAGNWALDAASLGVFLLAFGHPLDPAELFLAYGLANLVAIVPISPGGLGVIEGVLIPSLVGFGIPPAVAILGVVTWRLFDFWAPIPAAGLCYASLRLQRWRRPRPGAGPATSAGA
jgi:uncharacterized protein (TIRG00374 family)